MAFNGCGGASGRFGKKESQPTEAQAIFRAYWTPERVTMIAQRVETICNDPRHPKHATMLRLMVDYLGKQQGSDTPAPIYQRLDETEKLLA